MCARRGRSAAGLQRGRCALVGGDPPACARRLVHRAPHDRMAEAEAPRRLGGTDEVARQERVERLERLPLGDIGRHRRQIGLEWVADDGGSLEHASCGLGQRVDLVLDRRGDGRG